ncbi:MAG: hypothetical protein E7456_06615 [Ruminococcaceae bacterium]|nr:hypothetical protein [Oscillospiraceae bacterium]
MKNKSIIFIVVCMVLCLIPSVGMLFFPTTETTENRAMAEAPQLITEEGTFNRSFFQDFEDYFTEHIALRNQLVYTDAKIQTKVFHESNVSGVINGTNGWLYYSSTLEDYLGTDVMSERELYNLAHNFSVIQDYLNGQNIDFVLTIAPNKNTLYGDNMPYYASCVVNEDHNAKLLAPMLSEQKVSYLDLFSLFESQDETLYLLRDSHWNMKGACLAYNAIMDDLELAHEDYSDTEPMLVKNENGDLNKMLYSFYGELEENYSYDLTQEYVYANDVDSVEDGWIITENQNGNGTLLMFRDSFANTLIPFMSNEFKSAYYSKGEPNAMERFVEMYAPDCVVIEKVERNISNYLDDPPIITPTQTELPAALTIATTDTTVEIEACLNDVNYYKLSGTVDAERIQNNSEILVSVDGKLYRAYQTGEDGYSLYLKQSEFTDALAEVRVYVLNDDGCIQALSVVLNLPE